MPTQKELLDSAKAIDDRINNARTVVKSHKQSKAAQIKKGEAQKAKAEAHAHGRLI